jgi:hypothetical protein
VDVFQKAGAIAREEHVPVLIHVQELTQTQGHSTSGSHERYKSAERLAWEVEYDCLAQMRIWLIENNIATAAEIEAIDAKAKKDVLEGKKIAWEAYLTPIKNEQSELITILNTIASTSPNKVFIQKYSADLAAIKEPIRKDVLSTARKVLRLIVNENGREQLAVWITKVINTMQPKFSSHLHSESDTNVLTIKEVLPTYDDNADIVDARLLLRDNFDTLFTKYPEVLIFGEDAGKIGDVNQGLEGMQEKYGEHRVSDVGIREASIIGQGIGMAMRGLRPIAEIQYLDYLLYAIQIISDDLATLQYRTAGRQKAPLII